MPPFLFHVNTVKSCTILALIAQQCNLVASTSILSNQIIIEAQHSFSTRREVVTSDDDAFLDRHTKIPEDKTGVEVEFFFSSEPPVIPSVFPSASPIENECVPEEGFYGDETTARIEISYTYEVELYNEDSLERMDSEIVPAVEGAVLNSLLPEFINDCSKRRNLMEVSNPTRLSNNGVLSHSHRRLGMQGASSKPDDYMTDMVCASSSLSEGNCAVVKGGMSFYLSEGSLSTEIETASGQVLDLMKKDMNAGLYNDSHDEIIGIAFVEDDIPIVINKVTSIGAAIKPENNSASSNNGTVAVASCATLALVAIITAVARRRKSNARDENGSDGDSYSNGDRCSYGDSYSNIRSGSLFEVDIR